MMPGVPRREEREEGEGGKRVKGEKGKKKGRKVFQREEVSIRGENAKSAIFLAPNRILGVGDWN